MNLKVVAIGSVLLAAAAMAALFSLRSERNLFAEGAAKAGKLVPTLPAADSQMRSCVINGKKVISNTECSDQNKTSKAIVIHDSRGFEAPKAPPPAPAEATSDKMTDKMIEKQLQ